MLPQMKHPMLITPTLKQISEDASQLEITETRAGSSSLLEPAAYLCRLHLPLLGSHLSVGPKSRANFPAPHPFETSTPLCVHKAG